MFSCNFITYNFDINILYCLCVGCLWFKHVTEVSAFNQLRSSNACTGNPFNSVIILLFISSLHCQLIFAIYGI